MLPPRTPRWIGSVGSRLAARRVAPATSPCSCLSLRRFVLHACGGEPDALSPELRATKIPRLLTVTGGGTGSGTVTAPNYGETPSLNCVITGGTARPGGLLAVVRVEDPGPADGNGHRRQHLHRLERRVQRHRADLQSDHDPVPLGQGELRRPGHPLLHAQRERRRRRQRNRDQSGGADAGHQLHGDRRYRRQRRMQRYLSAGHRGDARRAAAAGGHTFEGWSGNCGGTGTCVLTIAAASAVSATFSAPPGIEASIGRWDGPFVHDDHRAAHQPAAQRQGDHVGARRRAAALGSVGRRVHAEGQYHLHRSFDLRAVLQRPHIPERREPAGGGWAQRGAGRRERPDSGEPVRRDQLVRHWVDDLWPLVSDAGNPGRWQRRRDLGQYIARRKRGNSRALQRWHLDRARRGKQDVNPTLPAGVPGAEKRRHLRCRGSESVSISQPERHRPLDYRSVAHGRRPELWLRRHARHQGAVLGRRRRRHHRQPLSRQPASEDGRGHRSGRGVSRVDASSPP